MQLARRELPSRSRISLASLNVNGRLPDKIGELEAYLAKARVDIAALQEVGVTESIPVRGYNMFTHPQGDVAILVASRLVQYATRVGESDEDALGQVWVKLAGEAGRRPMYFASVHMPRRVGPRRQGSTPGCDWKPTSRGCNPLEKRLF